MAVFTFYVLDWKHSVWSNKSVQAETWDLQQLKIFETNSSFHVK